MNMAAEQMDCDLLLFLNRDITIVNPDWLQAAVSHAQQQRVGAVGAKLSFPDGRVNTKESQSVSEGSRKHQLARILQHQPRTQLLGSYSGLPNGSS